MKNGKFISFVVLLLTSLFFALPVSVKAYDSEVIGDVNGDGKFGVSDVVLFQRWLLGSPNVHLNNWEVADFTKDNKLDVFDLCMMKRELIQRTNYDEPMEEINISVRSLDELERMRNSLNLSDEDFDVYLSSISNGYVLTRMDIKKYVDLVSSLPVFDVENADITWINYSSGYSEDTGTKYDVAYITFELADGEWVRFEYVLSAKDAKVEIDKIVSSSDFMGTKFDVPVKNADCSTRVYAESREKHVSGNGDLITWYLDYNGMYIRAYYKTNDESSVDLIEIKDNLKVSNLLSIK